MSERGKSADSFDVQAGQNKTSARLALYRKYRPSTLDQIIGQPQVTDILKIAAGKREFTHAYLFTGQRGTGKTSAARILAHLINETEYGSEDFDIIEIDAASRGSVDDARELREKSFIAPVAASHKIYIIDEVHMLSTAAFNALLKIIEEPPEHIVFILATTELQKVPATILSRVQRFHFRPVETQIIANHLRSIADREKIKIDDEALELIAERGGGSFRDSISLLDQLSGSNQEITKEIFESILGLAPSQQIDAIIAALAAHDPAKIVKTLSDLSDGGINTNLITDQIVAKLMQLAPEKPKLYALIDNLLEVPRSAAPHIKLLAVLSSDASKSISTVAAVATSPEDAKLAAIIEKKISREPRIDSVEPPANPISKSNTDAKKSVVNSENVPAEIAWQDVLDELRNLDQPAALATLKLANTEYEDGKITLYFDKNFHRKKADSPKCRDSLAQALLNLYHTNLAVTIATTTYQAADSKNSLVAGVAAIMGGGDIVKET